MLSVLDGVDNVVRPDFRQSYYKHILAFTSPADITRPAQSALWCLAWSTLSSILRG